MAVLNEAELKTMDDWDSLSHIGSIGLERRFEVGIERGKPLRSGERRAAQAYPMITGVP
jgi:hypothetical protein